MKLRMHIHHCFGIASLAVALVVCYVFLSYVWHGADLDSAIAHSERVFRVEQTGPMLTGDPSLLTPQLAELFVQMPHVEAVTAFQESAIGVGNKGFTTIYGERMAMLGHVSDALPMGLSAWGLHMVCGSDRYAKGGTSGVIIPASVARQLYGTEQAVGRELRWYNPNTDPVPVVGVYRDLPEVAEMPNAVYHTANYARGSSGSWWFKTYIRLDHPDHLGDVERAFRQRLDSLCRQDPMLANTYDGLQLKYTALRQSASEGFTLRLGDAAVSLPLGGAGDLALLLASFAVLLMAMFNALNIGMVAVPMHMKSINTRLVLGQPVGQVWWAVVAGSVGRAALAFLLAVVVLLGLSQMDTLQMVAPQPLSLTNALNSRLLLWLGGFTLLVGVVSALYPAYRLTHVPLSMVIRARYALSPRGRWLRTLTLGLQLAMTSAILLFFGLIVWQNRHALNTDYGFDKERLLYARNYHVEDGGTDEDLRSALMEVPGVEDVSFTDMVPFVQMQTLTLFVTGHVYVTRRTASEGTSWEGEGWNLGRVDKHYFRTMGIDVLETGDADPPEKRETPYLVLQQRVADQYHQQIRVLHQGQNALLHVDAVCEDLRLNSLREADTLGMRNAFIVGQQVASSYVYVMVRVAEGVDKQAMADTLFRRYEQVRHFGRLYSPEEAERQFRFHDYDEVVERLYAHELRLARQMLVLAVSSILVTLLGLLAVAMVERRHMLRSMAIRRVLGMTTAELILMQMRRYGLLLLAGAALGMPLAYVLAQRWLATFYDRTVMPWWMPLSVLALLALIVGLVVVWQNLHAATKDLTLAVKTE